MTIADPGFTIEPPRWPFAYARSVVLADAPAETATLVRMTLNADALAMVVAGSGHDAAGLIAAGSAGQPLPAFDAADVFAAKLTLSRRTLTSANVIGILPGSDPAKAREAIVLSAHLDGYGHGEPVAGDGLYNGTLVPAGWTVPVTGNVRLLV